MASKKRNIQHFMNTKTQNNQFSKVHIKPAEHKSLRNLFEDPNIYVIDSSTSSNVGRYFNHSCQPNVFVQNVFVDTQDPRFPWITHFALKNISAGSELTWDYAYEIGSMKGKKLQCYCEAQNCRGRLL